MDSLSGKSRGGMAPPPPKAQNSKAHSTVTSPPASQAKKPVSSTKMARIDGEVPIMDLHTPAATTISSDFEIGSPGAAAEAMRARLDTLKQQKDVLESRMEAFFHDIESRVSHLLKEALTRVGEKYQSELEIVNEAIRQCETVIHQVAVSDAKAQRTQDIMKALCAAQGGEAW